VGPGRLQRFLRGRSAAVYVKSPHFLEMQIQEVPKKPVNSIKLTKMIFEVRNVVHTRLAGDIMYFQQQFF
jgi:hypothetical protein